MKNRIKKAFNATRVLAKLSLFLLFIAGFQACKKSSADQPKPLSLAGKWVWTSTTYRELIDGVDHDGPTYIVNTSSEDLFIQFNGDGTGTRAASTMAPAYLGQNFAYSVSGNLVTFYASGLTKTDTLTTFNQSMMTIRDYAPSDDIHYKYVYDFNYKKE